MENDNLKDSFEDLFSSVKEYIELRKDGAKLRMAENLTLLSSRFISLLIMVLLGAIAVGFLSIALSSWLSELLNSPVLGPLITGGVLLLLLLMVFLRRERLFSNSLVKMFIKLLFSKEDRHENQ